MHVQCLGTMSSKQRKVKTMTEWTDSPRRWEFHDKKKKKPSGTMKISAMTYNILAQSLLEDNSYLYDDCDYECLDWSFRGPALMKQFEHHMSDILCLQEVQEDHWKSFFQSKLASLGYEGYFEKRTGDKPDGCAILFKQKKFKLIEYIPVKFQRGGLLDRDNVGVILLLKPRGKYYRGNVRKICVATTHLLFNPKRGDVKLAQLMLFLAEIEKHSYLASSVKTNQMAGTSTEGISQTTTSHPYCPVIFCGDMNLEPHSPLFGFISKGHIRYDGCISQQLSGQHEGMGRGYSYMSAELLPKNLGINDHCQFIKHALNRLPLNVPFAKQTHDSKCGESSLKEGAGFSNATSNEHINRTSAMNTGHAYHNFNFKSVYPHYLNLVTTHHGRASCMVDYIFYSCGETIRTTHEPANDARGENKSQVKKRRRTESTTSEKQFSSVSVPSKTLKGESKNMASSIKNDIEKHEQLSSSRHRGRGKQLSDKDCSSQNSTLYTTREEICDIHDLEPGEIFSSDNLEGSRLDDKDSCGSDAEKGIFEYPNGSISTRHSINVSIPSLEIIGYWSLMPHREFQRFGSLPNNIFPSDHICLIAKFLLN